MVQSSSLSKPLTTTWREYFWLTKPRVISLLLFTAIMAMFIAAGGWPGLGLFASVFVGGYMSVASANVFNMIVDRDIDARMKRTAARPTVTQAIGIREALIFAVLLMVGAFLILWLGANLPAALLSMAGLGWYVLVYTLYMKRRFWSNIVIGGAAGAFPPLVGWVAVTGELGWLPWLLFALIFYWTPVHFWALALMIKEDYRTVGIPMLPVVMGERATAIQIGLYAILTVLISVLPLFFGQLHGFYLLSSLPLNAFLLKQSWELYCVPERSRALRLYKYSMLYLALVFMAMAVDRALWM
jgi:protoheme IX farnesyltransferase